MSITEKLLGTLALGALLATSAASAQQVGGTPVEVSVTSPPAALFALGRFQLVYELHVTNFGTAPLLLVGVDVLDGTGAMLDTLRGPKLAGRVSAVGATAASTAVPAPLLPGGRTVAYMWIALPPGKAPPSSLQHRLTLATPGGTTHTVLASRIAVDTTPLVPLAAPVQGGPWLTIRGPSNSSGHRLSFVAENGHAGVPQRYAVDWALLGPDGKLFHGDSTNVANWYGYGAPVYAAAGGVVVRARNDAVEHNAFAITASGFIEAADATGNSIVIDMGRGRYATYAHLKPGTVGVKPGDTIVEGQLLARLGNSGNTLGPHLHFHVNSAPESLAGEGLPYVLRNFELMGRVNSLSALLSGAAWAANPAQPARSVLLETPLENMVVRLPATDRIPPLF